MNFNVILVKVLHKYHCQKIVVTRGYRVFIPLRAASTPLRYMFCEIYARDIYGRLKCFFLSVGLYPVVS